MGLWLGLHDSSGMTKVIPEFGCERQVVVRSDVSYGAARIDRRLKSNDRDLPDQRHREPEPAAATRLAVDADGAAHRLGDTLADRHEDYWNQRGGLVVRGRIELPT